MVEEIYGVQAAPKREQFSLFDLLFPPFGLLFFFVFHFFFSMVFVLVACRTAIAAQPPTSNVLLGVGQPWGHDRQLDNNLVMICITHCLAEHLMEMLHRHRWEQQCPFDADYLMIDKMDEDDKLAMSKAKQAIESMSNRDTELGSEENAAGKVTPLNLSALPMSQQKAVE